MDDIKKIKEEAEKYAKEQGLDSAIREFVLRHQEDVKAKEIFEGFTSKGSKLFDDTPELLRQLPPIKQVEKEFSKHTYEIFLEDMVTNFTIHIVAVLKEISESERKAIRILGIEIDVTRATIKGVKELLAEDEPELIKLLSNIAKAISDEEYETLSAILDCFTSAKIIIAF